MDLKLKLGKSINLSNKSVEFYSFKQEQLLGSLDNFQPELPDTEDDEVKMLL